MDWFLRQEICLMLQVCECCCQSLMKKIIRLMNMAMEEQFQRESYERIGMTYFEVMKRKVIKDLIYVLVS